MRAVVASEPGGPDVLTVVQRSDPNPGPNEVLIEVAAAGVNRADLHQRAGNYPPPDGETDVLGLECSGRIEQVGSDVYSFDVGDEVCALLGSGGYAEKVVVPAAQVLPRPGNIDLVQAAALPETVCTVWANVFMLATLRPSEVFLVHGGASGIGTTVIQLANALGARVLCTAGSEEKVARCRQLGADVAINYHEQDFAEVVKEETDGHGADVILDIVGGKYLPSNVRALAVGGRLVVIGMQGGRTGELDLGRLLAKRAAVFASGLRARPAAEKQAIVDSVQESVWPLIVEGYLTPIVDRVLGLDEAAEAHRVLEESGHVGKVLLTP